MMSKIFIMLLILFTIGTTGLTIKKIVNNVGQQNILEKTTATVPANPTTFTKTNPNQCIVVLSGQQYDVTKLQNTHSGGNIFQCGTDMTNIYNNQHGSGLSLVLKYLIRGTTNSVLPTALPQQNNNNERGEDKDDD